MGALAWKRNRLYEWCPSIDFKPSLQRSVVSGLEGVATLCPLALALALTEFAKQKQGQNKGYYQGTAGKQQ